MIGGLLLLTAAEAAAAPLRAPASTPDEIIVTGERVKRALKDTPSSVGVVTERELEAMPADRVEQVLGSIPNVVVGSGSQGPTIRGQDSTGVLNNLPAFLGGTRPRATLEVDGRAVGFQEFVFGNAPLWDVHQIEVYRSPQTVTHGRNAIGGGIVITTNDPTYGWQGAGRVIGGSYATGEGSVAVSGPLVADELAFRFAGDLRQSRTTSRLAPLMRGADPNDDKYSLLRFKLLGEPRALPGFKVVASFTRSYSLAAQVVPVLAPFRDRVYPFGGYGIYGIHVSAGTVHATQQFDAGQIEAIVSYGSTRSRRYAEPGFGESRSRLEDLSGEMFGSWKLADGITLRGGVHSLASRFRQHIDLTTFVGSIGDFRDRQHSFGVFGEIEFAVTPRLTVDAGGRYQQDSQRRVGGLAGDFAVPIDFDARFSAFLPKFTASYALTPRLKAGVLVQRGYNPGGATIAFDTGELDTFGAERLWDYEAFFKGDLSSSIAVEANIFYNDITDAQRGLIFPFTLPSGEKTFLERYNNVPRAWTRGAEVELDWHPSNALRLSGGIGLLRTRLEGGRDSDGAVIGREFEGAPHLSASAAADWSPVKPLRLSAQLRYHASYFSDDFDTPELRIAPAATVDARAAYAFSKFTLFAYVRNVFDSFHLRSLGDAEDGEADDPRTAGVGLEAKF